MRRPTLRGEDRMVSWNIRSRGLVNTDGHVRSHVTTNYFCVRLCLSCVWRGIPMSFLPPQYRSPSTGFDHRLHGVIQFHPHLSACLPLPAAQESGGVGRLWLWSSPLIGFLYICSISSPFLCFIPPHLPTLSSLSFIHRDLLLSSSRHYNAIRGGRMIPGQFFPADFKR